MVISQQIRQLMNRKVHRRSLVKEHTGSASDGRTSVCYISMAGIIFGHWLDPILRHRLPFDSVSSPLYRIRTRARTHTYTEMRTLLFVWYWTSEKIEPENFWTQLSGMGSGDGPFDGQLVVTG